MDHMHEVAVMQNVVETLLASMEKAGASRVTNVQLALSTFGPFTEEAVHLYFQALTRDTPIEGATLTLSRLPATYQCCLASIALRAPQRGDMQALWRCRIGDLSPGWVFHSYD